MALFAAFSQRCLVFVLGLVAGIATAFCILKRGRQVAFLAGCGGVQTDKRKTGQIMVESNLFQPAAFLVTTLAAFTLLAAVNVVAGVAIVALS